MALNRDLFQSESSVLSGRLIKNMFPLHICRSNDYTIEIVFGFRFSFTIFLLMFLPLFPKVVTNILKIYELPKIYHTLKIVHNNHLPGQFYVTTSSGFCTLFKIYTWGQRNLLALNLKKILGRILILKCSAKRVLLFCCIRCCFYSPQ